MTNAGKTYTIAGPDDQPGLLPRTLAETFRRIADKTDGAAAAAAAPGPHSHRFSVLVSYLEVYNEQVYDLLSHSAATSGPTSAAAGNGGAAAASSSSSAAAQQQGGGPTDFALMLRGAGAAGGAASNRTAGGGAAPGAIVREPLLIKDGRFVSP